MRDHDKLKDRAAEFLKMRDYTKIYKEYAIPDSRIPNSIFLRMWRWIDVVGYGQFRHPNGGYTYKFASVECGTSYHDPEMLSKRFHEVYHLPYDGQIRVWDKDNKKWGGLE